MKDIWFRRKIFGWGWIPWSWQGWVITILYIIILFLASNAFDQSLAFWLVLIISTVFLIIIASKKGERPKWSWGYKDSRKEPEEKYKKYY